ncbi:hypothetical protein EIE42_06410 [Salmonella enterica subsp. enterica]|nr:hypothetical protein [Salmonella enterica subsp. enterica serovar Enteritidis]EAQ5247095.1 hypothetical protein [Salmonella enterica]EAS5450914.1 hypothetical protein [Salmonella enterica]ECS7834215.1 hypothetical protein [Salmonella enterica subsp. enterica serovar Enteritidis]EDB4967431.1 hypothetical protein [Salmonella enterica subsp. enterica serovar Enteritidis]
MPGNAPEGENIAPHFTLLERLTINKQIPTVRIDQLKGVIRRLDTEDFRVGQGYRVVTPLSNS